MICSFSFIRTNLINSSRTSRFKGFNRKYSRFSKWKVVEWVLISSEKEISYRSNKTVKW